MEILSGAVWTRLTTCFPLSTDALDPISLSDRERLDSVIPVVRLYLVPQDQCEAPPSDSSMGIANS
jgi:hypothetical protein